VIYEHMVGAGIPRAEIGGMAHRQFVDAGGVEWTVYDVIPRMSDRRSGDRRDTAQYADQSQLDRRGEDRRAPVVNVHPVRITRGWLCFESSGDRRRLQPIPEGWHLLPDSGLITLLQQARSAPRRVKSPPGAEAERA
jgi:hypothetical protein